MQNKGAIKLFAILLGLACVFYLSFTWVTRGVESDAVSYAENASNSAKVKSAAKDYAKGNSSKELSYIDSVKNHITDRYLDSMKKQSVYNILIAEYTYEECKKNEINLGLDLRGGMNVTLEVSVMDIIKNLTNNNADINFNTALAETQKNLGVNNNDDFITLFEKTFKKMSPNALHMQGTLMTSLNGPSNQRSSWGRRPDAPCNVAYLLGDVSRRKAGAACDSAVPSVEKANGKNRAPSRATSTANMAVAVG